MDDTQTPLELVNFIASTDKLYCLCIRSDDKSFPSPCRTGSKVQIDALPLLKGNAFIVENPFNNGISGLIGVSFKAKRFSGSTRFSSSFNTGTCSLFSFTSSKDSESVVFCFLLS